MTNNRRGPNPVTGASECCCSAPTIGLVALLVVLLHAVRKNRKGSRR